MSRTSQEAALSVLAIATRVFGPSLIDFSLVLLTKNLTSLPELTSSMYE